MTRLTGEELAQLIDQAMAAAADPQPIAEERDKLLARYGDMDQIARMAHTAELFTRFVEKISPPAYETTKAEDMKALRYLIRRYPAEAAELLRRLSPSPGVASPSCGAGEATPNQT